MCSKNAAFYKRVMEEIVRPKRQTIKKFYNKEFLNFCCL